MPVWELEAYDTDLRAARHLEYTTSKRRAEKWEKIPRIQFTDSGHGIVFHATPHKGKRKPEKRGLSDYVSEQLRKLHDET